MEDLTDLIQYTFKYDHTIKKICLPLQEALGIDNFVYYIIKINGDFGILSNYPEQHEFYYKEKLYLNNPFKVHPRLLKSGYALIPATYDPVYLELNRKQFQINHLLLMLQKTGDTLEGFGFASKNLDPLKGAALFSKIEMFHKFALYFKREAKSLIEKMMADGFNLKDAKKEAFFQKDPLTPLSIEDPNSLKFLKEISDLSSREQQCLELFKKGKSAQATADILGLSRRTVEHYLDNLKAKLNCDSKWELLEW